MSDPFKKFDGLTYREISHRLRTRQLPEPLIDQTITALRAYRAQRANAKRRAQANARMWAEVLEPLRHERGIVRSMARYKTTPPNPEREQFVTAYAVVLATLHERLTLKMRAGEVPEHSHWVDFIPEHIKARVQAAADAVPHRAKVRTREPFQRTAPSIIAHRRKHRLLAQARGKLSAINQEFVVIVDAMEGERPSLEQEARLAALEKQAHRLRVAIKRINATGSNDHVPNHWSDMVPDLFINEEGESK